MLASIWAFLLDESNRTVLGWIGGGAAVLVGSLWGAFKFFTSKVKEQIAVAPTVTATHGGVAGGRDVRDNRMDIRSGT